MPNQLSFFKKTLFKTLSVMFAFIALTGSIVFSQSKSNTKKEKKKDSTIIFPSSKSGLPLVPKKEKSTPKSEAISDKEETGNLPQEETKVNKQKQEPKKDKSEDQVKEQKKYSPIMPSSKSPDPSIYK